MGGEEIMGLANELNIIMSEIDEFHRGIMVRDLYDAVTRHGWYANDGVLLERLDRANKERDEARKLAEEWRDQAIDWYAGIWPPEVLPWEVEK
jgi:hypothetical protein